MTFSRTALFLGALAALPSGAAWAQGKGTFHAGDEVQMGGGYRSVVVELPINVMARETVGRVEFNLQGRASLAVEGMMMPQQEEVDDKTKQQTGESLVAQGKGAALFVARYSDGMNMAGFFWGLGVGYRDQQVKWHDKPDANDAQVSLGLEDQGQMLTHDADLKGTTGHLRVGYRYVGTEVPLLIGLYAGARHFQPTITDNNPKTTDPSQPTTYAPLTDKEKDRLRRVSETSPEVAVELGFMF